MFTVPTMISMFTYHDISKNDHTAIDMPLHMVIIAIKQKKISPPAPRKISGRLNSGNIGFELKTPHDKKQIPKDTMISGCMILSSNQYFT